MPAFIDLTGRTFGRWTVLGQSDIRRGRKVTWRCRCECGTVTTVIGDNLRASISRSCGCLDVETSTARLIKHGGASKDHRATEYTVWKGMHRRCRNTKDAKYSRYGGRGIRVCDAWKDFAIFVADMGPRPSLRHSIDRIDNDGHYEPSNCRWIELPAQAKNRRSTIRITIDGETLCLKDWTDRLRVDYGTVYRQIRNGVAAEDALKQGRPLTP